MNAPIRVLIGDPAETPQDACMDFRLTYEGRIASGASASAQHKHDIRRQLHPQLRKLWESHRALWNEPSHRGIFDAPTENGYSLRRDQLANYFRRGDYRFLPLERFIG
jgi:hypothetical protein